MRKNSIKNTRINGEVLRELSNIIRGEIKDPRINPMTSVVTVEVAPDLKTCKAYISVLGMRNPRRQRSQVLEVRRGTFAGSLPTASTLGIRRRSHLCWISPSSTVCACPR